MDFTENASELRSASHELMMNSSHHNRDRDSEKLAESNDFWQMEMFLKQIQGFPSTIKSRRVPKMRLNDA